MPASSGMLSNIELGSSELERLRVLSGRLELGASRPPVASVPPLRFKSLPASPRSLDMRIRSFLLPLTTALLLAVTRASAQTADEIVSHYLQRVGGADRVHAIQ